MAKEPSIALIEDLATNLLRLQVVPRFAGDGGPPTVSEMEDLARTVLEAVLAVNYAPELIALIKSSEQERAAGEERSVLLQIQESLEDSAGFEVSSKVVDKIFGHSITLLEEAIQHGINTVISDQITDLFSQALLDRPWPTNGDNLSETELKNFIIELRVSHDQLLRDTLTLEGVHIPEIIEDAADRGPENPILSQIRELLAEVGGFEVAPEVVERVFSNRFGLLGEISQYGISDTAVMEQIAERFSRELLDREWPTYGSELTDEEHAAFYRELKRSHDQLLQDLRTLSAL